MPSNTAQNDVYTRRINTVISHVRENLDGDLSLDALSRVGCFSKFHFHRVFKSITEETVNDMVVRMRLERAANLLRTVPRLSITAAAFEVGFSSVSVFSRAFRKHFGVSARQWDRKSPLENSKNGQFRDEFPRYTLEDLESFESPNLSGSGLRFCDIGKLCWNSTVMAHHLLACPTAGWDKAGTNRRAGVPSSRFQVPS